MRGPHLESFVGGLDSAGDLLDDAGEVLDGASLDQLFNLVDNLQPVIEVPAGAIESEEGGANLVFVRAISSAPPRRRAVGAGHTASTRSKATAEVSHDQDTVEAVPQRVRFSGDNVLPFEGSDGRDLADADTLEVSAQDSVDHPTVDDFSGFSALSDLTDSPDLTDTPDYPGPSEFSEHGILDDRVPVTDMRRVTEARGSDAEPVVTGESSFVLKLLVAAAGASVAATAVLGVALYAIWS